MHAARAVQRGGLAAADKGELEDVAAHVAHKVDVGGQADADDGEGGFEDDEDDGGDAIPWFCFRFVSRASFFLF
jgi:hypothetical protein